MLKKKHLICSPTMSYRSMGTANYRTWRHPNLLLSPDHLLPSPVVCRSLPSLKSKWRFDDLTAHSYQNVSIRVPLAWNSSQHTRFPSCLTTFRHLLELQDTETPSWRVGKKYGKFPPQWFYWIFCILPLHLAEGPVYGVVPARLPKSHCLSHASCDIMDSAWIYYVSDIIWLSFDEIHDLSGFPFMFKQPIRSSNFKPDTPAISHTPWLCLPKRFVAKAKAHATLLSKVPQAAKDSVAPLNRNVNATVRRHDARADGLPFGLQEAKAFMASAGLNCSWIFGHCLHTSNVQDKRR